ncbi:MAG: Nif3-like dinuclear metal center hexameric protein [Prevotella sp.]|nr:Nif3-like dinuclear metal center hexameric protein [Prevotella sp.]MCM1075277.1 Nif3-like dinuclear metal center hexameric protein [Ruminococcus sp.]
MMTVAEIAAAIEEFAPRRLQESYDNAGLQVGDPQQTVSGVILCLDVTTDILNEAVKRRCNMIVSHHPVLFGGMKHITPEDERGQIIISAISHGVAIYAAHTNLDRTWEGVSYEIARSLQLTDMTVLCPDAKDPTKGLGIIGNVSPKPALSFLRQIKEAFNVECLRYSRTMPKLTIRKVAVCGGAGASLIHDAVERGADIMVTGDVKYHDFTTFAGRILIADIGHYESEICTKKIFARILRDKFPELTTYLAESEVSPIACI